MQGSGGALLAAVQPAATPYEAKPRQSSPVIRTRKEKQSPEGEPVN